MQMSDPAAVPGREDIMTKFRIITVLLTALLLFPMILGAPVQAAEGLRVNLYAAADTVKAGDTISLSVNFSTFPHLTRFGPVEVQFDPSYVSFAGMDKGSDMPSTFSVTNTASTNVIAVLGVDQTTEGLIAANQTAPVMDAAGNPIAPPADPSMYSDASVTVCVLYFKVIDNAPTGEANFWLGGIGGFRDSLLAQLPVSPGNTVIVPVQSLLSSEASLASLTIEGATLSPEFSAAVFSYEVHVSRSVTKAEITATPLDSTAQVMITGNDNLKVGDNPAKVRVAAQDGKTALEYKINIIRDSNFVPANASITDITGKVYTFVEIPDTLSVPSGFSQKMELLGTQTVPVYVGNGFKSILLYLKDGESDPALYIYNLDTGTILLYQADLVLTMPAQLLTISEVPTDQAIPDGYFQSTVVIGEKEEHGYISQKSDVSLIYLTDEEGVSRFYEIDSASGSVYPYKEIQTESNSFLIPFVIVSVLAVAEFGMIFYIIYQVRSRSRPKEVKRV